MRARTLSASPLRVRSDLLGTPLASPFRRLVAFAVDCVLLLIPSAAVAVAAAVLALWLTDPAALHAIRTLVGGEIKEDTEVSRTLGQLAPVLVRIQAPGLPPDVAVAVEESDLARAGEILNRYSFDITLTSGTAAGPRKPDHVLVALGDLIPRGLRSAALFGTAALYFTFFAARRRRATPGKRLVGIQLRRLDGRPLSWWESFERFGGYLASLGTFGFGLLDFWRDTNRRLAHDRIANTVVLRTRKVVRATRRGSRRGTS